MKAEALDELLSHVETIHIPKERHQYEDPERRCLNILIEVLSHSKSFYTAHVPVAIDLIFSQSIKYPVLYIMLLQALRSATFVMYIQLLNWTSAVKI